MGFSSHLSFQDKYKAMHTPDYQIMKNKGYIHKHVYSLKNCKNFNFIDLFQTRNKKARSLPLVLGAPLDADQGTTLVIGIPPLQLDEDRKK